MAEEHQLVTRQKAFVLLQVFTGPNHSLKQSELPRKFTKTILRDLGPISRGSDQAVLDKSALEAVRDELVQGGYLQRTKKGKTPYLQVTEKGTALLLSSPQYHSLKFTMTGEGLTTLLKGAEELLLGHKDSANGLNLFAAQAQIEGIFAETLHAFQDLFAAARMRILDAIAGMPGPAASSGHPASSAPPTIDAASLDSQLQAASPTEADLKREILAACDYLLQEKYTQGEMVPIHAVRRRVEERLGEEAASHTVFDPAVQYLGRQHKVRLVSISDRRVATDDEINASIPGANETFFYLKVAHDHTHA
jgi:hypothetical protein